MPSWAGHRRKRADYRFLAIREPLRQLALSDAAELPFSTQAFGHKRTYKLFGVVTNLKTAGECMRKRALAWRFPAPRGVVTVRYPVSFSSG